MRERDVFLQLDRMAEAASRATSFIDGMTEEDFLQDARTQQAVAMSLLLIGECVATLKRENPQFIAQYAHAPWQDMAGMRNRIAHGYFDLNWRTVWRTTRRDLDDLLIQLRAIYEAAGEKFDAPSPKTSNT